MPNLEMVELSHNSKIYGDITNLANLIKLKTINLTPNNYYNQPLFTGIYGDISVINEHPSWTDIDCRTGNITGDLSSWTANSKLRIIYIERLPITGDISAFANCTNLQYIYAGWCSNLSGNISGLSNKTNLLILHVNNTNVSGDASSLNNLPNLTTFNYANSKVTGT